MTRCKYYDNGKCKVLGEKITIDCQTVKNSTPNVCKEIIKNKNVDRKNRKDNKRDGFSGTSGKFDNKN